MARTALCALLLPGVLWLAACSSRPPESRPASELAPRVEDDYVRVPTRSDAECAPVRSEIQHADSFPGQRPVLLSAWLPDRRERGRPVEGTVSFTVLEDGRVDTTSIEVHGAVDDEFRRAAREVALNSRFAPAMYDGCTIVYRMELLISF